METIKKYKNYVFLGLLMILFLKTCTITSDTKRLIKEQEKTNQRLDSILNKTISSEMMNKKLEDRMWQALELEEMGDKGKTINELKNQYRTK